MFFPRAPRFLAKKQGLEGQGTLQLHYSIFSNYLRNQKKGSQVLQGGQGRGFVSLFVSGEGGLRVHITCDNTLSKKGSWKGSRDCFREGAKKGSLKVSCSGF